jgi:hypothetical protein
MNRDNPLIAVLPRRDERNTASSTEDDLTTELLSGVGEMQPSRSLAYVDMPQALR